MGLKKLKKIYGKNYTIKGKRIVRTHDYEDICNFYIKSILLYTKYNIKVFFEVEYVIDDDIDDVLSVIIPYEYYTDPVGWVNLFCHQNMKIKVPKMVTTPVNS